MPLVVAPIGKKLRILKILAEEEMVRRLADLGITIDGEITVVSNIMGSITVDVKGSRLALDKGVATKILVR